MTVQEVVHGEALAHNDVGLNLHTETAQIVDFGFYDFLFGQPEFGDAIDEDSARVMERLEDGDAVAHLGEVGCTGEACGAGADDGHTAAIGRGPRGDGGGVVLAVPVGNKALQRTDGYGLPFVPQDAAALALGLLRAYAATDGGK